MGYASVLVNQGDAPSEHVRYILQALHKASDGVRAEAFATTDIMGKVVFDTSASGQATLKLGFHDDATKSDDNGLTREMYEDDPRQPTLSPADHIDLQRYDVSLTHEQRVGESTKVTTLAYAYRTARVWTRQVRSQHSRCFAAPLNQYATLPTGSRRSPGIRGLRGSALLSKR